MSTPINHCRHCSAVCRENFVFCYPCVQQIPEPLRREMTRNYRSRRNSRSADDMFSGAVKAACEYLKRDASGRNQFARQQWCEGNGWATQFLLETGQITSEDDFKMLRERANLRGEK